MSGTRIKVSTSYPGTVIRSAFAIESALNIALGSTAILAPDYCLSSVVRYEPFITPVTSFLLQTTGTLLYALSVPLLLSIPNTRRAIESRRTVYFTLGAGEAFLIPLLLWKLWSREDTGIDRQTLSSAVWNLMPMLGWRIYCLWRRPEWFGEYEIENEPEKKNQ